MNFLWWDSNSSNYDLNVIKPYFFQRVANLAQQTDQQASHDTTDPGEEKEEEEEEKEDKSKLKFLVKNMNPVQMCEHR